MMDDHRNTFMRQGLPKSTYCIVDRETMKDLQRCACGVSNLQTCTKRAEKVAQVQVAAHHKSLSYRQSWDTLATCIRFLATYSMPTS